MLRLASYDIVFQEIPGEVTLALNLSGCPNACPGCHSPHLQQDIGEVLDEALLEGLLKTYGSTVTCVCFMGGDAEPHEVQRLAAFVNDMIRGKLKTAWYSGKSRIPACIDIAKFNFVKTGPYIEKLGGLTSPGTNQRFYRIDGSTMVDMTAVFRK